MAVGEVGKFKVGQAVTVSQGAGDPSGWEGREVVITFIHPPDQHSGALNTVSFGRGFALETASFWDYELEPIAGSNVHASIARKLRELADGIEGAI